VELLQLHAAWLVNRHHNHGAGLRGCQCKTTASHRSRPLQRAYFITAMLIAGCGIGSGCLDGGYYFNGMIDEVRIHNRVLSANEIQRLSQMG
jgi:hypothetical protein